VSAEIFAICSYIIIDETSQLLLSSSVSALARFATSPPSSSFNFGYDDCLDIFASHGVGGIVGNVSCSKVSIKHRRSPLAV
jgi:ammonia channel protein AmtB